MNDSREDYYWLVTLKIFCFCTSDLLKVTTVRNWHFPQICSEEEFFEFPKELLSKYISSEHLRVDTKFQVRAMFC
jgi:hypothetical protein